MGCMCGTGDTGATHIKSNFSEYTKDLYWDLSLGNQFHILRPLIRFVFRCNTQNLIILNMLKTSY